MPCAVYDLCAESCGAYSTLKGCFEKFPFTDILQPVKGTREFHPFLSYACGAVQRVARANTRLENSALLDVKKYTFLLQFVSLSKHVSSARYHQHIFHFFCSFAFLIIGESVFIIGWMLEFTFLYIYSILFFLCLALFINIAVSLWLIAIKTKHLWLPCGCFYTVGWVVGFPVFSCHVC